VLIVAAFELRHPIAVVVEMKAGDSAQRGLAVAVARPSHDAPANP
jgi:hypothetical protein